MTELIKNRVLYGLKDVLSQFNPVIRGEATRSRYFTLISVTDMNGGEWTTAGPVFQFTIVIEFHSGNKSKEYEINHYLDAIRDTLTSNSHYESSGVTYYHNFIIQSINLDPEEGEFVITITFNTQDLS